MWRGVDDDAVIPKRLCCGQDDDKEEEEEGGGGGRRKEALLPSLLFPAMAGGTCSAERKEQLARSRAGDWDIYSSLLARD